MKTRRIWIALIIVAYLAEADFFHQTCNWLHGPPSEGHHGAKMRDFYRSCAVHWFRTAVAIETT